MTGHQINSLVGDLVAMAQAMERVPELEREISTLRSENEYKLGKIAEIEADLEQSRAYVVSLQAKLHEAEVAKDAAETMFLEADDRTMRALDFIKASFGSAGALIQSLEPPKPEPVVEAKSFDDGGPYNEQGQGASPLPNVPVSEAGYAPSSVTHTENASSPSGQSEVDPTEALPKTSGLGITPYVDGSASTTSWATPSPQPDTPPQPKPYEGRYYIDYPVWVSREDWLANGGTNESYDFRY